MLCLILAHQQRQSSVNLWGAANTTHHRSPGLDVVVGRTEQTAQKRQSADCVSSMHQPKCVVLVMKDVNVHVLPRANELNDAWHLMSVLPQQMTNLLLMCEAQVRFAVQPRT
jgi:hypothetical protein